MKRSLVIGQLCHSHSCFWSLPGMQKSIVNFTANHYDATLSQPVDQGIELNCE